MKEFDTAQVEQLKTIGDYLYRERQEKAISLDEIAVKTYIPLRLLQALELGNVERLPEPVFVQGFIRRYADAIGIDGTALSKSFSPQQSFVVERRAPESDHANIVERPVERPMTEPIPMPRKERDRSERSSLPFVLLGTAATLLVVVGLVNVFNRPQPATDSQPEATQTEAADPIASGDSSAQSTRSPAPEAANPSLTPSPQASQPTPKSITDAASSVEIGVNLTDESWLQVIADGKVEFEGTLKKGEQKTWKAKKTLVLQAGNAGAVLVSYNQGEAKVLGALGEVKDVTFPSEAAKPTSTN